MPDLTQIYRERADRYDLLVSREDHEGHLLPALGRIMGLEDIKVVELGAGTGRLTGLLAPRARSILAFDTSAAMVARAAARLAPWPVGLALADHRRLPVASGWADLALTGWSLCYLALWGGPAWQEEVAKGLREMERVLRPGGRIVILETLGTGHERPHRSAELAPYLEMLEAEGFRSTWVRTDYRFATVAEAVDLVGFFFGDSLAGQMRGNTVLPECTGLWWR